jgi:serine protease Do
MASRSQFGFLLMFGACLCSPSARADTLRITSTPAGANVEINGVTVGTTPYEEQVPGGYFHRTRTAMGRRLQYPMAARISLTGYATKEIQMTEGPMNWVSLKGHDHGEYWLLKASHFHVDLDPVSKVLPARSPRKSRKPRKRCAKPTSPRSRGWRTLSHMPSRPWFV